MASDKLAAAEEWARWAAVHDDWDKTQELMGVLLAEYDALRAVGDAAEAIYHQHHTDEGLRPEDPEWAELGAALSALDGGR